MISKTWKPGNSLPIQTPYASHSPVGQPLAVLLQEGHWGFSSASCQPWDTCKDRGRYDTRIYTHTYTHTQTGTLGRHSMLGPICTVSLSHSTVSSTGFPSHANHLTDAKWARRVFWQATLLAPKLASRSELTPPTLQTDSWENHAV